MLKLAEDIKNNIIKNLYLLTGNQSYLRNQYRDKLVNMIIPTGDTMNINYFNEENFSVTDVINLSETMPFLSEHRVIVIEDAGVFKHGSAELERYLGQMPSTTVIIFSEEKIDGRLSITKFLKQHGTVATFSDLKPNDLAAWVAGRIKSEHKGITRDAMDFFLKNCGTDMYGIQNELEKVFSYTFSKETITLEDVKAICTERIEDKVFLMLDAMFDKNIDTALKYYGDLVALQVEPTSTLALISAQLRIFIKVKELSKEGMSPRDMAKTLGENEYRIQKSLPHVRKSSRIWLMKALELCADSEYELKSYASKATGRIVLERLILSLGTDYIEKTDVI